MDTGTLISVVATIDAEINSLEGMLGNEDYSLTYEEEYALHSSIGTLQNLAEQFREIIEANIADMEARAQGE